MEFIIAQGSQHQRRRFHLQCLDPRTHPRHKQRHVLDHLQRRCLLHLSNQGEEKGDDEEQQQQADNSCPVDVTTLAPPGTWIPTTTEAGVHRATSTYPAKDIAFVPKVHEHRILCLDMKGNVNMYTLNEETEGHGEQRRDRFSSSHMNDRVKERESEEAFDESSPSSSHLSPLSSPQYIQTMNQCVPLFKNHSFASHLFVNERRECGIAIQFGVQLYDLTQSKLKWSYMHHSSLVTDVKCCTNQHSGDGSLFLTSSFDGLCHMYHSTVQKPVITISEPSSQFNSCDMVPGSPYQIVISSQTNQSHYVKLFDIRYHCDFRSVQSMAIFNSSQCPPLSAQDQHSQSSQYSTSSMHGDYSDSSDEEDWGGSWSQGWGGSQQRKREKPRVERAVLVPRPSTCHAPHSSYRSCRIKDHDTTKMIYHVRCTPKEVLTSSTDNSLKLWSVETGEPISSLHNSKVNNESFQTVAPVFTRNYEQVVCAGSSGHVYVWDTYRASVDYYSNSLYKFRTHHTPITAIAATELGDAIASCDAAGHVKLVQVTNY